MLDEIETKFHFKRFASFTWLSFSLSLATINSKNADRVSSNVEREKGQFRETEKEIRPVLFLYAYA